MSSEEQFQGNDLTAYEYCLRILTEEADLSYKEARRQARREEGVGVRRQVWTAARRELGLSSENESLAPRSGGPPHLGDEGPPHRSHEPREPRDDYRHRDRDDAPQRPPERRYPDSPPRSQPPVQRPQPVAREPRREPAPRPPAPSAPERRPDRPRPAWATPRESLRPKEAADPLVSPRGHMPSRPERPAPPPRGWSTETPAPRPTPPAPPSLAPHQGHQAPRSPSPAPSPGVTSTSSIEWMVGYLKTVNGEANFPEVREAAEAAGHTVYPATFGRAQAIAGILTEQELKQERHEPKPAPETAPVAATRKPQAAAAAPAKRPDGSIDPVAGLEAFLAAMAQAEKDSIQFKKSMRAMLDVVRQALEGPQ